MQTAEESALLSEKRMVLEGLPVMMKPLTKGLNDYLIAALQYTGSSTLGPGNGNTGMPERPDSQASGRSALNRRLHFLPEDEEVEWDEEERPRTPASTELNPAMW